MEAEPLAFVLILDSARRACQNLGGKNTAKLEGIERQAGWERVCWQPALGTQGGACFKTCPSVWACLATAAACQLAIFWLSKVSPPAFVECFYSSKL